MEGTSFSVLSEPTLVLNKHWQPIRVCTVRRAITLVFKDLARVLWTDGIAGLRPVVSEHEVRSAAAPERAGDFSLHDFRSWADLKVPQGEPYIQAVSFRIRVPEVIVLRFCEKYLCPRVVFSRRNLFRRDRNTCQYCGRKRPTEELSIDHILPRSLGGRSEWTNCVVACLECNSKKGNRTLAAARMTVLRSPREPPPQAAFTLHLGRRKASWEHFVSEAYWNVELED
ncbi:MAG: HNH endonuclease [Planctomycetota bacterium]